MNPTYFRTLKSTAPLLVAVLACFATQARALVGIDWTLQNLTPTSESFNGIACNGDTHPGNASTTLVIVGSKGTLLTATSASGPWTAKDVGITESLNAVTWSGSGDSANASAVSKFVVVGNNGTVLSSSDVGSTWVSVADATMAGVNFVSVFWTSSRFVIGGNGPVGPVVYSSKDGTTWTKMPALAGSGLRLKSVTGSLSTDVVAVTDKNIQTHKAEVFTGAWTLVPFPSGETSVQSMTFISTKSGGYVLSASTAYAGLQVGGLVKRPALTDASLNLSLSLSQTGAKVFAAGANGSVWKSFNGSDWTSLGSAEAGQQLHGAVDFGSAVVAVGDGGRIYSYSGSAWSTDSVYSNGAIDSFSAVGNLSSVVVALGKNVELLSSDSGATWTRSTPTIDATSVIGTTTSAGPTFIATGSKIWNSTDGTAWTVDTSVNFFGRLNRIASVGTNTLMAVGIGADSLIAPVKSMIYKFNGTTWSKLALPTTSVKELHGVAASPTTAVAVGDGGSVLTNLLTTTTWVPSTVALTAGENFSDVLYNGSQFVACTTLGGIWTSVDAKVWTKRQASTPGGLARILNASIGAQSIMLGFGGGGTEVRSFGGVYWFASRAGTGQSLADAVWTGTQLVAVGAHGTIMTSAGSIPPRPLVRFVLDKSSVNEGAGTATLDVQISPPSPLPVTVSYTGSTSKVGDTTVATLGTTGAWDYSLPTVKTITFPANPTGTSATPKQKITVSIHQDTLAEQPETATITLSAPTGDAGLDTPFGHTLTIMSDDVEPSFTTPPPLNQLLTVGSNVTLTATGGGFPTPTGVWKKNNVAVVGATTLVAANAGSNPATSTFSCSYTGVTTAHAGAYTLLLTNATKPAGTLSAVAQIGVVDNTQKTLLVKETTSAVLTVKAAGSGLSYRWQRVPMIGPPVPLDDDKTTAKHISGAITPTLIIKGITAGESDTYSCVVTQTIAGIATGTQVGGTTVVHVINQVPVATAPTQPAVDPVIAQFISLTPSATNYPYKWSVTGLPAASVCGLSFNATTGTISGRPLQNIVLNLNFTATNLVGNSNPVPMVLNIQPLPDGVAGTYMAVATNINSALDNLQGTRLDLNIALTGTLSGVLWHGMVQTKFVGALDYAPNADATKSVISGLPLALSPLGFAKVNLTFNVNSSVSTNALPNTLSAKIADAATGLSSVTLNGWRKETWNTTPPADGSANIVGRYNFAFTGIGPGPQTSGGGGGGGGIFADDMDLPQGYGAGTINIDEHGSFTMLGRMGDTEPFSVTGFVNGTAGVPNQVIVPVYIPLYSSTVTKGVAMGSMKLDLVLNADTPPKYEWNTLSGSRSVLWTKTPVPTGTQTTGRLYATGFGDNASPPNPKILQLSLINGSGKYTPPAQGEVIFNASTKPSTADNLAVYMYDGGVFATDPSTGLKSIQVKFDPEVHLTVDPPATPLLPDTVNVTSNNPAGTTITFDRLVGSFKGGFTLADDKIPASDGLEYRQSSFSGYIIGHRGGVFDPKKSQVQNFMKAYGSFNLPVMSYAGNKDYAGGIYIYRYN